MWWVAYQPNVAWYGNTTTTRSNNATRCNGIRQAVLRYISCCVVCMVSYNVIVYILYSLIYIVLYTAIGCDMRETHVVPSELCHTPHSHIANPTSIGSRLNVVQQREWLMCGWIFQSVAFNWMDSEAPVRGQHSRYVSSIQRSPGTARIAVSKSARVLLMGWLERRRHRWAVILAQLWGSLYSLALSLTDVSNTSQCLQ